MAVLVAVEAVVLALLALLVIGLLRSHAEILRRLHDLGAGDAAPASDPGAARGRRVTRDQFNVFPEVPAPRAGDDLPSGLDLSGVGVDDDAISIRVVGVDHRTLLAFLSSTCLTCQRFWDAFARPGELGLADGVRLVIVTKGADQESPARIADVAPVGVPLVMSTDAWVAYDVPGSPYFMLIDGPSGRASGEGTGIDWPQVRNLLTQVADDAVFAEQLERRRITKPAADDARERRIDAELMASGVLPGDPSLFEVPALDEVDGPPPDQDGRR